MSHLSSPQLYVLIVTSGQVWNFFLWHDMSVHEVYEYFRFQVLDNLPISSIMQALWQHSVTLRSRYC